MDQDFIFRALPQLGLSNDFFVRRRILEALPVASGFWAENHWVWMHRQFESVLALEPNDLITRRVQRGERAGVLSFQGNLTIALDEASVRNLAGKVVGTLVWVRDSLLHMISDELPRGLVLILQGDFIWVNQQARTTMGLAGDETLTKWNQVSGLPDWASMGLNSMPSVTVFKARDVQMRLVSIGPYVVGEMGTLWGQDGMVGSSQEWSAFLHEVRNPLAVVSAYLEQANGHIKDASVLEECLGHMTHHVERLVWLTREAGQLSGGLGQWSSDSFSTVLKNSWRSVMQGDKRIELVAQGNHEQTVNADLDRLRQILTNLLQNAVDAVGQDSGQVICGVGAEGSNQLLWVEDNGPGFERETFRQLFVDKKTTKPNGRGDGLVLVHQIVMAMGGKLQARHSKAGSRLTVWWPKTAPVG